MMDTSFPYQWLRTGGEFFGTLLAEIEKARTSIRLEMYIYMDGNPGDRVRDALLAAIQRGVRVTILLDAFGSMELPDEYWAEVMAAGGDVRFFNPISPGRLAFRDHRKLFICDETRAIVSGFNISSLETGDGVAQGWRDLGLMMSGPVVAELVTSFEAMFAMADFKQHRLFRIPLRPLSRSFPVTPRGATLLTSGPGQNGSSIKQTLLHDLQQARKIRVISGYFLPPRRIRRILTRSARQGRDVRIITAGLTDVRLARFAGRAVYGRLLRSGVRIHEYAAQILHTKLIIADHVVYIGSANLDTRSLNINYELLVRVDDQRLAEEARQIFNDHLTHSVNIDRRSWVRSRGFWEKVAEFVAHFLLARIDPLFARRQLRDLR